MLMSQVFPIKTQDAATTMDRPEAARFRSECLIALISFLILGFFIFLSTLETTPPEAVSSSAPLSEFSSGRAMKSLGVIAQKPRPSGSAEHSAVRDYIVREVTAMGLQPEIQKTAQSVDHGSLVGNSSVSRATILAGVVENILVKLPGTQTGDKAVLLSAHYDSVPSSAGASDDGSGVATLLETLRSLRAGPPLINDLIFLFTDGEEIGLLGAKAFVEKHPSAKNVKVALNFDVLGKSGASIMFQTTKNNGWIVGELAKAAPKPVANSIAAEIYNYMPYLSDLAVLARDGVHGLNFAHIDGAYAHHTQLDSLEAIDERSIQHNGSYSLALARHFGNISLEPGNSRDAVFFSVLGSFLIHYPTGWAIVFAIAIFALFITVVAIGVKRKRLTAGGMVLGFFAFLFGVIASGIVVAGVQKVAGLMPKGGLWAGSPDLYNSSLYFLGLLALAIAVISVLYIWFMTKTGIDNLAVGAMIPWPILMIYTSFAAPGGSYFFTWPLLFVLIAQGVDFVVGKTATTRLKLSAGVSLSTFPAIALIAPVIYFCFQILSFSLSPRVTAIFIAVTLLPLGLLISQLSVMLRPRKWLLPATAVVAGIAFLSVATVTAHFDRNYRMADSLFYAVNANAGRAIWGSMDERLDEWTSQYLTGPVERKSAFDFWGFEPTPLMAEAPVLPAPAPDVKVISDTTINGIRSVNLHVTSARQAPFIMVTLNKETKVRAFVLDGKRYDEYNKNNWSLRYTAPPPEGIELVLELEQPQSVKLWVTDQSYGVPAIPGASFKPRPDYLMPSSHIFNDGFLITKSFSL
jgi:hypothetical protein